MIVEGHSDPHFGSHGFANGRNNRTIGVRLGGRRSGAMQRQQDGIQRSA